MSDVIIEGAKVARLYAKFFQGEDLTSPLGARWAEWEQHVMAFGGSAPSADKLVFAGPRADACFVAFVLATA